MYVERRPQTLQLSLQQLGHEAALSSDPISLRGVISHAEWGHYPTVSEVDRLLTYLNPRGEDTGAIPSTNLEEHFLPGIMISIANKFAHALAPWGAGPGLS